MKWQNFFRFIFDLFFLFGEGICHNCLVFNALRRFLTLPQKINTIFFRKKFCRFNPTTLPLRQKAAKNKRAAEN